MPNGIANPLATANPTRSPVKLPGPAPHAIAASAETSTPARAVTSTHSRSRFDECRSLAADSAARRAPVSRSNTPTRATGVEVSMASNALIEATST
jgi:hypothetical protein